VISLQRGTLRLTHLIDNLLESVRLEAGQFNIRRQPVSLDEVVEAAIELVRPLHDQRGQTIQVELPYPFPLVCGDAARLTQVMVNLLANANKYAPAGSTILVGGAAGAETVAVWVEDNGPGLPDLPEPVLFARFVRSSLEEPEPSGAGLGLWIVKSIVERHGGRVEALRQPAGTRMVVILPHLDAEGRASA
jgi:signal transduction histidine kinase